MLRSSSYGDSRLHSSDVFDWLRRRYFNVSKEQYLLTEEQLRKAEEIREVFRGFDYDGSGFLELNELWSMFVQYGLRVDRNELRELFAVIHPASRDKLSLNEFRDFALSVEANESEG
jgi:Ca2+-binding EF-hand superfamily protein